MIRRTVFAITALAALAVAITVWAADDSFSFVVDDPAGAIERYEWLDTIPDLLVHDVDQIDDSGQSGAELRRFSTPGDRLIVSSSRSCPPLLEIRSSAVDLAVVITALNPRVDWRCGGYRHTYLELTLNERASPGDVLILDTQTS
ncbi:MAG: hypothetical protein OEM97_03225 [Acidimicrobiia bacterium]|nr:hypothetical protein [Acidimicrobiia bacterium]